MGALLTQNTNWKNVEQALVNLSREGVMDVDSVLKIRKEKLAAFIKPSGYFNQKAIKLKELARRVKGRGGLKQFLRVSRDSLLQIKGIGPETADSILLYAGKRPFFVVDAYTRRLFGGKFFSKDATYNNIRAFFESSLPKDRKLYNEFHALIVEKGKRL